VPRYAGDPTVRIESIALYGGAGDSGDLDCQWFRWAADQYHAFDPSFCRRYRQPPRHGLAAIALSSRGPFVSVVLHRSNKSHEPLTADVAALGVTGFLQGVACDLPSARWRLCIRNVRLFLANSEVTRRTNAADNKRLISHIASALRQFADA
jgi:hypothetical protein